MNWINVKDALPNKNQEVLVYRGSIMGNMMNVYTYLGDDLWEDDYGYWNNAEDEGVTHWMPLPDAPKE